MMYIEGIHVHPDPELRYVCTKCFKPLPLNVSDPKRINNKVVCEACYNDETKTIKE